MRTQFLLFQLKEKFKPQFPDIKYVPAKDPDIGGDYIHLNDVLHISIHGDGYVSLVEELNDEEFNISNPVNTVAEVINLIQELI